MTFITTKGLKALRQRIKRMSNTKPMTDNLRARLQQIWRIAGEAFIRAAMRHILVETGMSAASFFPLARAIKREKAQQVISGEIKRRRGKGYTPSGYKRRKFRAGIPELPDGKRSQGIQNPRAGEARGKKAFVFTTGGTKLVLKFSFTTLVFQLAWHEDSQHVLDAGLAAFEEAVSQRRLEEIGRLTLEEYLGTKKFRRFRSPSGLEIV